MTVKSPGPALVLVSEAEEYWVHWDLVMRKMVSQWDGTCLYRRLKRYTLIEYRLVLGKIVLNYWTRLSLGLDSISLKCLENMKTVYLDENNVVLDENSVERKPCINRESKSFELTI